MKKNPLISIIINCYNGEKYLKHEIQSVINQSYIYWEIIFWDNQSKDKSADIVKSFKDDRIKYYYSKKFMKLYEARNEAIKKINGEYLCFLDCDDYWHKDKLINNLEAFTDSNIDIVYSKITYIKHLWKFRFYKNQKYNFYPSGSNLIGYFLQFPTGLASLMIKSNLIIHGKKFFNDEYEILADYDFVLNQSKFKIFKGINKSLVFYRLHGSNFTTKNNDKQITEQQRWINNLKLNNDIIYQNPNFKFLIQNLNYIKTMNSVSNGNFNNLIKLLKNHKSVYNKFKFILAFIFRLRF